MSARTSFVFDAAEAVASRLDALDTIKRGVAVADPTDVNLLKQLPAALVYPLLEAPAPSVGGRAATVQRVNAELGVLHVVRARNTRGGEGHVESVGSIVESTREALVGWTPRDPDSPRPEDDSDWKWYRDGRAIGADIPLALAGGALEDIAEGRIYWLDRYGVEWVLDSQGFSGA